jgi:hypothetical protein
MLSTILAITLLAGITGASIAAIKNDDTAAEICIVCYKIQTGEEIKEVREKETEDTEGIFSIF